MPPSPSPVRSAIALAAMVLAASPGRAPAQEASNGEAIYRNRCAACHGPKGEGTEDYPRALAGDRSVAQLRRLIERTMPEDEPGTCVGDEAEKVAAYIHETFYSSLAQARNRPARVELSRLTVRQYRNAVADLIGGFRAPAQPDGGRGLKAEYFKSRRFRNEERVLERLDSEICFDFDEHSPDAENLDSREFSIRWSGTVFAPETGEYEFILRSEQATRVWVNHPDRPLIDALVRSGKDNEYRASIHLLGGRAYPLRVEFSKAKQGVDDSKKNKKPPPPVKASISLEWKPPYGVAEVVPERVLSPGPAPETFVVATPFPPDDRSAGYERGTAVSKAWDQATTSAAIAVADEVVSRLRELSGTPDDAPDRDARLRAFCAKLAERAFRRPLDDRLRTLYVDRQFDGAADTRTAVKRSVLLTLKSPRFLYREIGEGSRDPYEVASRLAFGLWDSLPDGPLLAAAASNALATREQVGRQAERTVTDPRTRAKVREFFLQWLRVEQAPDLSKNPELFPEFDAAVAADLRTSLDLFLDRVLWSEGSDFRRLLLSDSIFLNGRLARLYGVDLPADAPFREVRLDPEARAGVLSHPYLLATFAYTSTSSPIHRGVFLSRSLLGRGLRPPPEAVAPLAPDLHAGLTTRERVALQTSPASCMTCHGMINPLGFALEHFDAIGRYRREEKGRLIDASGVFETRSGDLKKVDGARRLAAALLEGDEARDALVEQLFHHLVKQPIRAFGPEVLSELRASFVADGYDVRKLIVRIVTLSALAPDEQIAARP